MSFMCSWGEEINVSDLISAAHHRNILTISTSDPMELVPGGIPCIKVRPSYLLMS